MDILEESKIQENEFGLVTGKIDGEMIKELFGEKLEFIWEGAMKTMKHQIADG